MASSTSQNFNTGSQSRDFLSPLGIFLKSTSAVGDDLIALQQATEDFLSDRRDGECGCLEKQGTWMLPSEHFVSSDVVSDLDLTTETRTTRPIFDLIDDLIEVEEAHLTPHETQDMLGHLQRDTAITESRQHSFYDADRQEYVTYTALEEVLSESSVNDGSKVFSGIPDVSDSEFVDPEIPELGYYDVRAQGIVAYTALNQLFLGVDDSETLPRIHRAQDEHEDFIDNSTVNVLEIGEIENHPPPIIALSQSMAPNAMDLLPDFHSNTLLGRRTDSSTIKPFPGLYSNASYQPRKARRRAELTIITQLDIIEEMSTGSDTSPNTMSSTSYTDFTGLRDFVRPLSSRRSSFLSDEGTSRHIDSPLDEDTSSGCAVIVPVENTSGLFTNDVGHNEPDLAIPSPCSAEFMPLSPFHNALILEILENVEMEINSLVARMFECLQNERTNELLELGSDLQWALDEVSCTITGFGLVARLGDVIEILLEPAADSGTN